MKKITAGLLIASAASLAPTAYAIDGCKVILCLAGGSGVAECRPTLKDLFEHLAKPRPFPTCSALGTSGNGTGILKNQDTGDQVGFIKKVSWCDRAGKGSCARTIEQWTVKVDGAPTVTTIQLINKRDTRMFESPQIACDGAPKVKRSGRTYRADDVAAYNDYARSCGLAPFGN